jgi:hypothetical protein
MTLKDLFSLFRKWTCKTSTCEHSGTRHSRIESGTPTEFVFCNRKFGAVILDASDSGMKLSCEIRLGIGSIIHLVNPAISGKIVWRDDEKKSIGIRFVKDPKGSDADL